MSCKKFMCREKVWAKKLCKRHYGNQSHKNYIKRLKEDPQKWQEYKDKRNAKIRERYNTDTVFREKERVKRRIYSKKYLKQQYKDNPDFYKERSKKLREKDPVAFNKAMAKCYMKKLSPEKRQEVLKEL